MGVFSGYRYALDAKNSRQYAIQFLNGKVVSVGVYPGDVRDGGLKAHETVVAFDDESTIQETPQGLVLSVGVFQLKSDALGNILTGDGVNKYVPVEYEINLDTQDNIINFKLTSASVSKLQRAGCDGVPSYKISVKNPEALRALFRQINNGEVVPFPPHHPEGGADIARLNTEKGPTNDFFANLGRPDDEKTPGTPWPTDPRAAEKTQKPSLQTPYKQATKPMKYKYSDSHIEALIGQFCKDLTEAAQYGKLDPVVGRNDETQQSLKVLTRRKQASLCFTGEPGVGKSAMFAAIAQAVVNDKGELPESLRNARILQLDLQGMLAGTRYRGDFEARIKPFLDGLAEREGVLNGRKVIIAMDEIHLQLSAGGGVEGGASAGNMMKEFMTSRGISVMGTTTAEEYKKHIEKDGALVSRFEQLVINPTNEEDTIAIAKTLWPLIKEHHRLTQDLTEEQFRYIVTMTTRYAPQEAQPRKTEKVIDMAASSAQMAKRDHIAREDILAAIAQMSKLPVNFLNQSDDERFAKLEHELPQQVLGQPGLQRITDGLQGSRGGFTDEKQPWGCFVLQGPTGTGKTEACKALARYLFGSEDALIKLDMSEYGEKHTVSRLIGAPPGYVGFEDSEPALTEKIRQRPYSILLLDEIEKAHPDVFNVLLPMLNDGKMTDNHGKTVLFNNVIVVMTTNAGAARATTLLEGKSGMGFTAITDKEKLKEQLDKIYAEARQIKNNGPFRPEMINRVEELGGFITFLPLDPVVVEKLAVREVEKIAARMESESGANLKGAKLVVTEQVLSQLAKEGYNPSMGARPLRKVVREKIANPLGKWVLSNRAAIQAMIAESGSITVTIESLNGTFAPKIETVKAPVGVSNDNASGLSQTFKKKNSNKGPGM